jgi:hypothetical protein
MTKVTFQYTEIKQEKEIPDDTMLVSICDTVECKDFLRYLEEEYNVKPETVSYPHVVTPSIRNQRTSVLNCSKAFGDICVTISTQENENQLKNIAKNAYNHMKANLMMDEYLENDLFPKMEQLRLYQNENEETRKLQLMKEMSDKFVDIETHDLLKQNHDNLLNAHMKLKDDHMKLKDDHMKLKDDHMKLKDDHMKLQDDVSRLTRKFEAEENIHKLVEYISLFRSMIIERINSRFNISLKTWKEMKPWIKENCSETDIILQIVGELGLSSDAWGDCISLSRKVNENKHSIISCDEALEIIAKLKDTSYEKYSTSLEELINLPALLPHVKDSLEYE